MARFLGLRGNRLTLAAILGVLMPAILTVGYNTAVLGGVLSVESFRQSFPEIDVLHAKDPDHASTLEGTVVAAYAVGSFLGTCCVIWLGDVLGRRWTMMTGAIIQVIAYALNATTCSLPQLIASRLLIGVGTGLLLATAPLWISETSPAKKRGSHVVTKGAFSGLGCASALFLDYGMSFKKNTDMSWRLPFGFPVILSLAVVIFAYLLPESPRWLIRKARIAEAREALAALSDTDIHDERIDTTIKEVQSSLDIAVGKSSFKRFFEMGTHRTFHRAALAVGAMIFLQLTGATVTTFYTTAIFETSLGLEVSTARLLAGVYQLAGPIGAVLCVFVIEKAGRRRLMIGSALGNAICLACIAGLGSLFDDIKASHAAVFFLFLFHFTYILGFGGIPYLYASEIAPLHLRSTINSVSISISGAFSILIANMTPLAFNAMGQKYFLVFAGLNVAMTPVIYFYYPETSGRSLEEIDDIFTVSESALDAVRVARHLPSSPCRQEIVSPIDQKDKNGTVFKEKELQV
ncbi:Major facilitator superfamily domain general substrate transporter [Penicillium angulare]|uniref:Major facilitator superfamily domain general substrate transporter n=1 Tax=Penicillium angulare TaxID=116970 RepID=UPI00253F7E82|nr:Major facilitator superfamily domain general substrate transporter [Penicillium angulare]KAJ5289067.1 Major facilitator superfamily domain general substrate transporter [Penicillium angulare]